MRYPPDSGTDSGPYWSNAAPVWRSALRKIELFSSGGPLDPEGNIQFGEGGAGTFSDGKLNTGTHGSFNREVLETFVEFGAPEEILWLNKPHIGSDNLRGVVRNMREYIVNHGGRVLFNTRLSDIVVRGGRVTAVKLCRRNGEGGNGEESVEVSALVLAIGHSARDTFEMLLSRRRGDFPQGLCRGGAHRAPAIGDRPRAVRKRIFPVARGGL